MPLYEYRCNECGEEFEKMLRFSEADRLPACPKCASSQTQKRLSKVASFGESAAGSVPVSSCGGGGGFS